jgi:transcriptional regulator GlxA family with amidase domain
LAHEAARELVLFLRRPGGQPQVSVSLASQASAMASIRELQIWIAEHLTELLTTQDLAQRMSMSVRNFERGLHPGERALHRRSMCCSCESKRRADISNARIAA